MGFGVIWNRNGHHQVLEWASHWYSSFGGQRFPKVVKSRRVKAYKKPQSKDPTFEQTCNTRLPLDLNLIPVRCP